MTEERLRLEALRLAAAHWQFRPEKTADYIIQTATKFERYLKG